MDVIGNAWGDLVVSEVASRTSFGFLNSYFYHFKKHFVKSLLFGINNFHAVQKPKMHTP